LQAGEPLPYRPELIRHRDWRPPLLGNYLAKQAHVMPQFPQRLRHRLVLGEVKALRRVQQLVG
jgi:hypothetical protein